MDVLEGGKYHKEVFPPHPAPLALQNAACDPGLTSWGRCVYTGASAATEYPYGKCGWPGNFPTT